MDEPGTLADASSLIYLAKAGAIAVTTGYLGPLLVTPAVWAEAVDSGEARGSPDAARIRLDVEQGLVKQVRLDASSTQRARRIATQFGLGRGESEVLAIGGGKEFVLLDEHRATRAARHLGILCVETIVVPGLCVRAGVIGQAEALALLDELAKHSVIPTEPWVRARAMILEVDS